MARNYRELTQQDQEWIFANYANTKNADIKDMLGISLSAVRRFSAENGLIKSPEFIRACRLNACKKANEACKKNGYYEKLRKKYIAIHAAYKKNGIKCPYTFQKGVSNIDRLGAAAFSEMIERGRQSRLETIRKEKLRIKWGLPQKTKLRLSCGFKKIWRRKSSYRNSFRKKKYIVPYMSNDVFYTPATERSKLMERRATKYGLNIKKYEND